jgi:hypothetical protein
VTAVLAEFSSQARRSRKFGSWLALLGVLFLLKLIIVVVVLPDYPLVPDEGLYVVALEVILRGENIVSAGDALGYGPVIFTGSWMLLRPAQLLTWFELGPLESLRLTSLFFGSLTSLLVVVIVFRARGNGFPYRSAPGLALLTLTLMPSYQFWGILALRDAAVILCMTLVACGVTLFVIRPSGTTYSLGLIALFLGVTGMYMSRSYLAIPMSIAAVLAIAFPPLNGRRIVVVLAIVALSAGNLVGYGIRGYTQPNSGAILAAVDSRVSSFAVTREGMRGGADSAYRGNYCRSLEGGSLVMCEALYLPLGAYRFLLTPNPLETGAGISRERLLAGVENIVWFLVLIAAIGTVMFRRTYSLRIMAFCVALLASTTVGYALVSGNEGTAFRHKGQFLFAWCLLIALGYGWRPWIRPLLSRRRPGSK